MPHPSAELIGKFEMRVAFSAQFDASADQRIEAIAAWLLAQWRAEQEENARVTREERRSA